jgi:hypothetical protein
MKNRCARDGTWFDVGSNCPRCIAREGTRYVALTSVRGEGAATVSPDGAARSPIPLSLLVLAAVLAFGLLVVTFTVTA